MNGSKAAWSLLLPERAESRSDGALSHAGGHWFESSSLHQKTPGNLTISGSFCNFSLQNFLSQKTVRQKYDKIEKGNDRLRGPLLRMGCEVWQLPLCALHPWQRLCGLGFHALNRGRRQKNFLTVEHLCDIMAVACRATFIFAAKVT